MDLLILVLLIEIVRLEGALGHVTMGEHGNPECSK